MARLIKTRSDYFDDIHKANLDQPLPVIKMLLQVTTDSQACLDHHPIQSFQMCAL